MPTFNWDIMPVELRKKLLDIAKLDAKLEGCRWTGLSNDEKKVLNEALLERSRGTATLKGTE